MRSFIALISMVALVGCASIVSTNIRPIQIKSTPSDAKIIIWNEKGIEVFRGSTPTTVSLTTGEAYFHRKKYVILFLKEGFENKNATIRSRINPWYFGNILFGPLGFMGKLIVDPLTGNMWTLSPRYINETLAQKTSAVDNRSLIILSLEDAHGVNRP